MGATDVRLLPRGRPAVQLAERAAAAADRSPTVLWVGRMLHRKAPVLAVEGFAELRRTMQARLVMAGDGPLLEQVRRGGRAARPRCRRRAHGQVPWSTVNELCESATSS